MELDQSTKFYPISENHAKIFSVFGKSKMTLLSQTELEGKNNDFPSKSSYDPPDTTGTKFRKDGNFIIGGVGFREFCHFPNHNVLVFKDKKWATVYLFVDLDGTDATSPIFWGKEGQVSM